MNEWTKVWATATLLERSPTGQYANNHPLPRICSAATKYDPPPALSTKFDQQSGPNKKWATMHKPKRGVRQNLT